MVPPAPAPHILVVDDDEPILHALRRALEYEGLRVSLARDGFEALERVRRDPPDVLVLDITLPDGDGAEWLSLRRKRGEEVAFPVVALTGITADEDTRRIEQSGVVAVLQKPVNVALLFQVLQRSDTDIPYASTSLFRKTP